MPICLLSTMDTKGREALFLKKCLEKSGRAVLVVDAGLFEPDGIVPDISRFEVAAAAGADLDAVINLPRDQITSTIGRGASEIVKCLCAEGRLEGVLGLGGNQGTAIVCAPMRELALGFPKMVISTVGSGNMRPYIGDSDIVVELVLRDAAAATAGRTAKSEAPAAAGKPLVPSGIRIPQLAEPSSSFELQAWMLHLSTPAEPAAQRWSS